jgi:hypothetical protein
MVSEQACDDVAPALQLLAYVVQLSLFTQCDPVLVSDLRQLKSRQKS